MDTLPESIFSCVLVTFVPAHALSSLELTRRSFQQKLSDRTDLWLACLDQFFGHVSGKRQVAQRSKRLVAKLKALWVRCVARIPEAFSCGDRTDAAFGSSVQLFLSQEVGKHRSLVADRELSTKLPMTLPCNESYGLAHYAYFEMTIGEDPDSSTPTPVIRIGLASSNFQSSSKLPGVDEHSIALDGTNGMVFFQNQPIAQAETFAPQDIVGCGIADSGDGAWGVFFVKNGHLIMPHLPCVKVFKHEPAMYPVIGIDSHSHISASFFDFPSGFNVFHPQDAIEAQITPTTVATRDPVQFQRVSSIQRLSNLPSAVKVRLRAATRRAKVSHFLDAYNIQPFNTPMPRLSRAFPIQAKATYVTA